MRQPGAVKIQVWNVTAEKVCVLDETKGAGPQASTLDIHKYANGVYLYKVQMAYSDGSSESLPLSRLMVCH